MDILAWLRLLGLAPRPSYICIVVVVNSCTVVVVLLLLHAVRTRVVASARLLHLPRLLLAPVLLSAQHQLVTLT